MPPGISLSDFYYILPEIVLTAGALLVLVADVLLPRGSRAADVGDTVGVLGATAASLVPFADADVEVAERPDRGRSVRALLQGRVPRRRGHDRADVGPLPRDRRREPRRVLLPDPLLDARHDDHGRRHRSDHEPSSASRRWRCRSTSWPASSSRTSDRTRRRSSTSCSAPSRSASCSTACRCCTGCPGRRTCA